MAEIPKTNASRILDQQRIPHELLSYPVDPDDLGAEAVAAKVGLPPEQVFKTLVLRASDGAILLACIPAGTELDLKALARAADKKGAAMVPMKEVLPLTGYIRGGVSPVGTKRKYPLYIDASAAAHPRIAVSAGRRGCQMLLAPADLLRATGGVMARIAQGTENGG